MAYGELRVSEEFIPNASLPEILCQDIGGCVNPYLNDKPITTDGRDDPFLVSIVPWQFNKQKKKEFVILRQFELRNKNPYILENWKTIRKD